MKKNLNLHLVIFVLLLTGIGIITLYSTTSTWKDVLWKKQLIWAIIGIILCLLMTLIDYSILKIKGLFIYIIAIGLLIIVLFMPPIRNARSWFVFSFFSFQPSELAKISTIIMLSLYLKDKQGRLCSLSSFLCPIIIILIPVFLILLQPDIGSSLIFFPIFFSCVYILEPNRAIFYLIFSFFVLFALSTIFFSWFFFKGYGFKSIFILISIIAFLSFLFCNYIKKSRASIIIFFVITLSLISSVFASAILKDYQRKRLLVFLNQSFDPLGAGYNIIQSKIAIGGAGVFGAGFLKGPQSHLGFLPERASDFIFSVYAEEWGFAGVFFLILLFFLLTTTGLKIARSCGDPFGSLLACGISTMIAVAGFINIGICCGILPVTGIPLPFISYGGSSLLINMLSIGILLSINKWAR
ncbi:MAG: rod shape-determining protein RodA [bacterium]